MAPMVATVAEAAEFAEEVRARGLKAGVMVEVPSAALLAHRMLEVVDFLSIGTNDLTQYTMAADRMATDLAHLTDPWQPAVLQLIAITAEAGRQAGKPVGVCGEAAADPLLACALVGMGITSLSMAAAAVRPVGARLATVVDGHLRGRRRGGAGRLGPDAPPARPCSPCSRADPDSAGQPLRCRETVTGTPAERGVARHVEQGGVGEVVDRDARRPRRPATCRVPATPWP